MFSPIFFPFTKAHWVGEMKSVNMHHNLLAEIFVMHLYITFQQDINLNSTIFEELGTLGTSVTDAIYLTK